MEDAIEGETREIFLSTFQSLCLSRCHMLYAN